MSVSDPLINPDTAAVARGVQQEIKDRENLLQQKQAVDAAANFNKTIDAVQQTADMLNDSSQQVITADIQLGASGGKILLSCEQGVEDFVRQLAKDHRNGLPNKMTGVLMKYLTEGIERDFGRTWDKTPTSLTSYRYQETTTKEDKLPALSKKRKNELIEQSGLDYYKERIFSGELSREEATKLMFDALDTLKMYEDAGYDVSKNKTAGVKKFVASSEVNKNYDDDKDHYLFYKLHDLEIVVPNLQEYTLNRPNNKIRTFETQLKKSNLFKFADKSFKDINTTLENYFGNSVETWNAENTFIASHLVKYTLIGHQKPRFVCYEGINKKTGHQSLLVMEGSSDLPTGGGEVKQLDCDIDA